MLSYEVNCKLLGSREFKIVSSGDKTRFRPYCTLFFQQIRVLSQKFGVTQHTQHRLYSHNTFFPSDESNPRAKQIKNIHSFNCFIQPASPWILIYKYDTFISEILNRTILSICKAWYIYISGKSTLGGWFEVRALGLPLSQACSSIPLFQCWVMTNFKRAQTC